MITEKTHSSLKNIFIICLFMSCGVKADAEKLLKTGFYTFSPYQYIEKGRDGLSLLTGLDIELIKALSAEARTKSQFSPVDWAEQKKKLKDGSMDFAVGVTYDKSLEPYVYYSEPYRHETNALFTLKDPKRPLHFKSVHEFLDQVQKKDFRLGVVEGFSYVSPEINAFIKDPKNRRYIIFSKDDTENMDKLRREEIDGFLADRLSGATIAWRANMSKHVEEHVLGLSVPIHIAFSRKSVSKKVVDSYNDALHELQNNGVYKETFTQYLHPLLLLQTLDSWWFFILEMIGTIAFSVSGLILAYKDRATLFGAVIYAILPATGGGILRDMMVGREPVGVIISPIYLYIALATVLGGYIVMRALERLTHTSRDRTLKRLDPLFVFSDGLGLGCFIVVGVMVAFLAKMSPLWLWGPFLAGLTGCGGGILRDTVSKSKIISALHGEIYPEIAVLWGLLLSLYLIMDAANLTPDHIFYAVLITSIGGTATRMAVYYYKIPNLHFSK